MKPDLARPFARVAEGSEQHVEQWDIAVVVGMDFALVMQFDSIEAQDAYQVDPDHHVFIDTCKHFWDKVQVRDLA